MNDLTIIYYTANAFKNKLSAGVKENLLKVAGNYPIVSVSQKPMNFGKNICVGEIGVSPENLYKQILIGARAAETEYVALAEDDCLYSDEHFKKIRPNKAVACNVAKWSFCTWIKPPMFSLEVNKKATCAMIAPRKLLIKALKEGIIRPTVEFWTSEPIVVFSHEYDLGFDGFGKKHGVMPAYDVAYWGRAEDMMKKFV